MTNSESGTSKLVISPARRRFRKAVVWTLITFRVLGILSAVDAIMSSRTSQGAIAWTISLVAAPIVAVPAYWVFGRSKFEGYVESRKEQQHEFDAVARQARAGIDAVELEFETRHPAYDALQHIQRRYRCLRRGGYSILAG